MFFLPFPDSVWATQSHFWHCANRSDGFKDKLGFYCWPWNSLFWRSASCSQSCHCSAVWSFDLSFPMVKWLYWEIFWCTGLLEYKQQVSLDALLLRANGTSRRAVGNDKSPCAYGKNSWMHQIHSESCGHLQSHLCPPPIFSASWMPSPLTL